MHQHDDQWIFSMSKKHGFSLKRHHLLVLVAAVYSYIHVEALQVTRWQYVSSEEKNSPYVPQVALCLKGMKVVNMTVTTSNAPTYNVWQCILSDPTPYLCYRWSLSTETQKSAFGTLPAHRVGHTCLGSVPCHMVHKYKALSVLYSCFCVKITCSVYISTCLLYAFWVLIITIKLKKVAWQRCL